MIFIAESLLFEYSQKVQNQLIEKFQKEKPNLTSNIILAYLDRFKQLKNSPNIREKDIFKYSWRELEQIVDLNQKPDHEKIKTGGPKITNSTDVVYNKNGLKILKGHTKKNCVKYGHGYSFCISARSGKNMYVDYRFEEGYTPYFVIDQDKSTEYDETNNIFVDPNHMLVIMVREDEEYDGSKFKEFKITTANNDGDNNFTESQWENVISQYNQKLVPLQELFVSITTDKKEKQNYKLKVKYAQRIDQLGDSYYANDKNLMVKFYEPNKEAIKKIDALLNNKAVIVKYSLTLNDEEVELYNTRTITQSLVMPKDNIWDAKKWVASFFQGVADQKMIEAHQKNAEIKEIYKHLNLETKTYVKEVKQIMLDYFSEKFKLNIK